MRPILRRLPAVLLALLLAACGTLGGSNRPEFRSLTIAHGRFDRPEIHAPAGTPLALDVTFLGPQDVTVSIPALGIGATRVPANRFNPYSVKDSAAGKLRKARFVLGPLQAGEYRIICDCPGGNVTARLVVEET